MCYNKLDIIYGRYDKVIKQNKKLSIIIPNYNNEKYLDRSIQYLIGQTYKNIEIIVVNDGSPGNSDEIVEKYVKQDSRVKYVKHEKNMGLFQARLTGADNATGDYIGFLDADDYGSIDFYRTLMSKAEETGADIIAGNTVLEYDNGNRLVYNLFEFNIDVLEGDDCLKEYFRQRGLNFSWHTIWNKIYSIDIWKKARKHYDDVKVRLLMTEDFAFSSVLFYYARKLTKVDNDAIFYCQHEQTSTSLEDINFKKVSNNIADLLTSFNFIESFLRQENVYEKYKDDFHAWKHLYANMHRGYVKNSKKITASEKEELLKKFDEYCADKSEIKNPDFFSSVQTNWNEGLEKIKLAIASEKIKYVSFDIFDTLVFRPLLYPTDLFSFLDVKYRKLKTTGIDFSKIRIQSESDLRKEHTKSSSNEDVTIDEIYEKIHSEYGIDKELLDKIKLEEKTLEKEFCKRRNTAFELYELALALDKKVIITSDMYLDKKTILDILEGCGYNEYHKIYISCEVGKTKDSGNLYRHVLKDLGLTPNEMVHIGDNYQTDYMNSKAHGINAFHFPKASDLVMNRYSTNNLSQMLSNSLPFWFDTRESLQFLGIRSMLAVVANKYFDNPFKSFNPESDFNGDPYLIGYFNLGMYIFGVSKWLIDNTKDKYNTLLFMSRDGYLPMKAYRIFHSVYENLPKEKYMYVSRKALIPVIIKDKLDVYKLSEVFAYDSYSPKKMHKYLSSIFECDSDRLKKLCEENEIKFDKKFKTLKDFNSFIKVLVDNLYDEKYLNTNREKIKKYYDKILEDKPAVFDVGYSGRPEFYISDLCGKKVGTFFLNINQDEALDYSRRGGFELKTYFPAKPTLTGNAYEMLLSELAGSCIGYDCSKKEVEPVFEEYKSSYQVEYMIEIMQSQALKFVEDMLGYFGNRLDLMYYQDYYLSLPFLAYLNSSKYKDKLPLSCIDFEDDVRNGGKSDNMVDEMYKEAGYKNQKDMDALLYSTPATGMTGKLNYNPVDLSLKSKPTRIMYYILFDRATFKRRVKEVIHDLKK